MISVVMSIFNEPIDYIKESISSMVQQTYKDLEIIIVIDNPDNNEAIRFVNELKEQDTRIKIIKNQKNYGLVYSLNVGIEHATGTYIARMDADDISEIDRLDCQLELLRNSDLDIVGCNITNIDEKGIPINNNKATNYPLLNNSIKEFLKYDNPIPHPTWLGKREIFDKYKYIDFPACEDYELLTRLAIDEKKFGNLKTPKLRYRINKSGISYTKKVIQKMSLSYIRKNYVLRKKSNLMEYNLYLQSKNGKDKFNKLTYYYEYTRKLKSLLQNRKYLAFFLNGVNLFFQSLECRNEVRRVIKEHFLQIKYWNRY